MTSSPETVELTRSDFEQLHAREFAFLGAEYGFAPPFYWEFAGFFYASFEDDQFRIITWCGKRDDSVWTCIEHLALGRLLALDTASSLLDSDLDYPPDTGAYWSRGEVEMRIGLEGSILRALLPDLRNDVSLFEEYGSPVKPESIPIDDPVKSFPRRCSERFSFLEREYDLKRELDDMGGTVLYRGDPVSVRLSLLHTVYVESDVEAGPTVSAAIANSPRGHLPPPFLDEPVEIPDRNGAFSLAYLERAFDEVERELRSRLSDRNV